MKKILYVLAMISLVVAIPVVQTGCKSAPSERVLQVQSLKAVGQGAEAAVELSAKLYRDGLISPDKARYVIEFYDQKFQPSYRVAVTAVKGDLNSLANPEVWGLFQQLTALVSSFQTKTP